MILLFISIWSECPKWELFTYATSETLKKSWIQLETTPKCMHVVTKYFIFFRISKELYIFFKKWQAQLFKLYQALFIWKKLAADNDG